MLHFLVTLLIASAMFVDNAFAQDPHQMGADSDRHLHDSQIPPPSQQPSRDDIAKMLSEVFTLIDKNDDKKLDGEELKNWLEKVHHSLIEENVEQQWRYYNPQMLEVHSWESYDPETKETISWEQYMNLTYPDDVIKAMTGDDAQKQDKAKSEDPNFKNYVVMLRRAEKRWKLADKNNDNILVKEEFVDFIHPEESDRTKQILVDEAMEDMDTDSNGEIALEEYIKHMTEVSQDEEKLDPNFWQEQQSQFATYLDKNKDGVLDKKELVEWLIPDYDRHEAEAIRMIHDADNDHDQMLNHDEVVKNEDDYFYNLIPAEFWRRYSHSDEATTVPTPHDEF